MQLSKKSDIDILWTYDILPDLVGVACLTGVTWDDPLSVVWDGAAEWINTSSAISAAEEK